MANISTAFGRMYIDRTFYEKNRELIDNWIDFYQTPQKYEWYGFSYVEVEELTEDELWLRFNGEGRWNWADTLKYVFASDDFESQFNPYKKQLTQKLYEASQNILMEYVDYEPGYEILVEREVNLQVEKYNDKYETSMVINYDIDLEYNDYNKVMCGVEIGYKLDDLEEVEALQEHLMAFYEENKEMIREKNFRSFSKDVMRYIKEDKKLNKGICVFRLNDDPGMFLEDMEESLKIA
ncbi:hypothetical protein DB321_07445 [Ligilactobacillus salivarius]|uniref:Uncharacterized protein n=3 Tax=Ligilactobacillus salivarius TaxID=1624 RepID=C2EIE6_9LACO|nr:hypothetical protein [Ligilactobacillus salivarius]ATP38302.1 hypothetical protein CR531_09070 [Ligilactobacillus salivarius]EEJ73674.1 hypothetical protein HMPREF0545_1418 [Ligilactobacillus salivarius DSM 20555 = ATCC 11741]KRM69047.1 hypothetical protein FC55_GL000424 [Ligilactobacillus salivarius DSM 20555 = ATCC 11741]MBE7938415.1 hypothetical protein [Ligilactobacillus salivarius]MDG9756280.1 hypothetical protein [Ligilactobacillus salivarius]